VSVDASGDRAEEGTSPAATTLECTLPAEGMDCPSCAGTVTRALLTLEGVRTVDADVIAQRVRVRYEGGPTSEADLRRSIRTLGYGSPEPLPDALLRGDSGAPEETGGPVLRFLADLPLHVLLGGLFWGLTIAASLLGDTEVMVGLLALVTVSVTGWSIFPRAWAAARSGALDMHVLMAVAALGALGIGEWVEAGAVLFLFAIARELEQRTLHRARSEVRSLMDLAPFEATVLRHGHHVTVPVEAVREGETILVRPGERIPVDGTVVGGSSEVDASAVTGESLPIPRFVEDRVFAGSLNGRGALEVRCDAPASASALTRILRSIEEARTRKSEAEAFVDRFARIYTPVVMGASLGVALLPPLLGLGEWGEWGYRALVLVVVACPCALVISTPVTVVSALTGAARRGILVKSGVALETLGRARVVALDKTGTLSEGQPQVAGIEPWGTLGPDELLSLAASAERRSEHPIARALLREAERRGLAITDPTEMEAVPGQGARALLGNQRVLLGSPRLLRSEGLLDGGSEARILELEASGHTLVLVAAGPLGEAGETDGPGALQALGAILLVDTLREGSAELIRDLRGLGVRTILVLSGDRAPAVAEAVRSLESQGGRVDAWRGELLPEEKAAWIEELRSEHGTVVMIGDGVNDAPALAAADVGIAMARDGTATAVDTASVALMEDRLSRIPELFRLGRKATRIIQVNIAFALAVKVVFVLMGGAGHATLWMAVVADMGSSLAVILNGLRALRV